MKLKYKFTTTALDDQIIAVPDETDSAEFSGFLTLNSSGAAILALLEEDTTVDRVVSSLMEEYAATREELTPFVEAFLNTLREKALLIE